MSSSSPPRRPGARILPWPLELDGHRPAVYLRTLGIDPEAFDLPAAARLRSAKGHLVRVMTAEATPGMATTIERVAAEIVASLEPLTTLAPTRGLRRDCLRRWAGISRPARATSD